MPTINFKSDKILAFLCHGYEDTLKTLTIVLNIQMSETHRKRYRVNVFSYSRAIGD